MGLVTGWLPDSVSVTRWTGENANSEPTYAATPEVIAARVKRAYKRVRDSRGNEVISGVQVRTVATIGPLDLVQAAPDPARQPIAVQSSTHPDTRERLTLVYL
jgi:hypothetical protein